MRLFLFIAFLFCVKAEALLPPVWQGVAEVKAILNDPQLSQHLDSGEVLESITKTDTGWEILTNRSRLRIDVIPQPQKMPGPEQFTLKYFKY